MKKKLAKNHKKSKKVSSFLGTFIPIEPGTFKMGSPSDEVGRWENEGIHLVTLTREYQMQSMPVTQAQWQQVMGNNPSQFKGDRLPVETVSWNDCQEFIQKLNALQDGFTYRLPTEAEWEFACRAGTETKYSFGNDEKKLKDYAWCYGNSDNKTHEVGHKKPNPLGLYDMHGNVWEWCSDWYGTYPQESVTDPTGPRAGSFRVVRGGGWYDGARNCRSAGRLGGDAGARAYDLGFRLVRTSSNTLRSNPLTLFTTEARKKAKVAQKIQKVKDILKEIEEML